MFDRSCQRWLYLSNSLGGKVFKDSSVSRSEQSLLDECREKSGSLLGEWDRDYLRSLRVSLSVPCVDSESLGCSCRQEQEEEVSFGLVLYSFSQGLLYLLRCSTGFPIGKVITCSF